MLLGVPMLRATLLAIVSVVPMSPLWHVRFVRMSNEIGSYFGWEPFFLCVIILSFELPSLTEETVDPVTCEKVEDTDLVAQLIDEFGLDTSTCFVMRFDMLPAVALFVVTWVVLTVFNAVAWKQVLSRYDPFGSHQEDGDKGGPYWRFGQCCYFGCLRRQKNGLDDDEQ